MRRGVFFRAAIVLSLSRLLFSFSLSLPPSCSRSSSLTRSLRALSASGPFVLAAAKDDFDNEGQLRALRGGGGDVGENSSPVLSLLSSLRSNWFLLSSISLIVISSKFPWMFHDGSIIRPKAILKLGIPCLFFFTGLTSPDPPSLSTLHLYLIPQVISLLLIPLFNIALSKTLYPLLFPPLLVTGMLLLSSLPTTISMCTTLTASCNGDCMLSSGNSVVGNILGLAVTPIWFRYFLSRCSDYYSGGGGAAAAMVPPSGNPFLPLLKPLLLPLATGVLFRPTSLAKFVKKHKISKVFSNAMLLAIIFNTFSNTFRSPPPLTAGAVGALIMTTVLLNVVYIVLTLKFFRKLPPSKLPPMAYSSTQKTIAFGLPFLKSVVTDSQDAVGLLAAPLIINHSVQLAVGTYFAKRFKKNSSE